MDSRDRIRVTNKGRQFIGFSCCLVLLSACGGSSQDNSSMQTGSTAPEAANVNSSRTATTTSDSSGLTPVSAPSASGTPPSSTSSTDVKNIGINDDSAKFYVFVSPNGSDSNAGTEQAPMQTIAAAINKVKSATTNKNNSVAGWQILLKGGVYPLSQPIVLDSSLSGSPTQPFVIKAALQEKPIVLGGKKLNLKWSSLGNGVWSAPVAKDQANIGWLTINGENQIKARFPNFKEGAGDLGGTTSLVNLNQRAANWKKPVTGVYHAMHPSRWGDMHAPILGYANNALSLGNFTGNNRMEYGYGKTSAYVDNIFEELDDNKEWFYDSSAGMLYVKPKAGVDLNSANIYTGELENLITLKGTLAAPVHDIKISGITFQNTVPTLLKTTEPLLRSDWKLSRTAAVLVDAAKDIEISKGEFNNLGGNAVMVSGYGRNIKVIENEIHDIGASAIAFVGKTSAVRNPLLNYGSELSDDKIDWVNQGPQTEEYPADSVAEENLIHNIGLLEKQVAGIQLSMSSRISVLHNSIYKVPRAGINVNDGTWGGHVIKYNDVFATVLESGDHGAFNSWGRDRYWSSSGSRVETRVAAHPSAPFLDAMAPVTIANNRFRCDHGWDIDLDDGSTNYIIQNNVLLSGGLKNREGYKRVNQNNIIVTNGFHPHVWFKNSGDIFTQNVAWLGHAAIGVSSTNSGKTVDSNLYPSVQQMQRSQGVASSWDLNSKVVNYSFNAPQQGDYSLPNDIASRIGFVNFPMDNFGVTTPLLKQKAEHPAFPVPSLAATVVTDMDPTVSFLGATAKTIQTLGEQSATGTSMGVWLQNVPIGSAAQLAGLKANDVIDTIYDSGNPISVLSGHQFRLLFIKYAATGSMDIGIIRNQQPMRMTLKFTPLNIAIINDNVLSTAAQTTGFVYNGSWAYSTSRYATPYSDYKNDIHYSNINGNTVLFRFYGTGLVIKGPRSQNTAFGFNYRLDNGVQIPVSIVARTTYLADTELASLSGLTNGWHTVELTKTSGNLLQIDNAEVEQLK